MDPMTEDAALTPDPQADESFDDLPDNDPGTDGIDPDEQGGEGHA